MAQESEDGQEKTEEPTPKRQQEAKEKGEVPRSRELNTAMVMIAAALALSVFGGYMGAGLVSVMETAFQPDRAQLFDRFEVFHLARGFVGQGLLIVAPFAAVMLVVALLTPAIIGGWTISAQPMQPKLEKINPIKGFKRIFGTKALVELAKAMAKVLVVGGVGLLLMLGFRDDYRALGSVGLEAGFVHGATLFYWAFAALSVALLVIAAVDVPYQLYEHRKKLRMTKQEIKEEHKQTEGKPEVKSKIRQLQSQLAQGRIMERVPSADVVVTNPTHYAVALKYDQSRMKAPQVVAKGVGLVALQIREIAGEHDIALFESPPLARAIYYTTKLEQEIPAGLYLAVAQILAYVYQLKTAAADGTSPTRPDPRIPDEFEEYLRRGGEAP